MTTLLFGFLAYARDHSALNGAWTLVPAKSDFAGQLVVQTGTVTISEQQGVIVVSRSFVYEGATESFFYNDSTGSENGSTVHTGKDLKTKTKWDHDVPEGDDHAIRRDYSRKLYARRGWNHVGQRR